MRGRALVLPLAIVAAVLLWPPPASSLEPLTVYEDRLGGGAATRSLPAVLQIAPFTHGTSSGPGDRTGDHIGGVPGTLAGVQLPFIANQGQIDARVAYYAPTFAGTVFVTRQGQVVYGLSGPPAERNRGKGHAASSPGWSLTETFRGGRPRPVAQERSTAGVSSFLGNDPARWHSQLPTWEQISLGEVWPGITVALQARGRSVEKVFTVQPGGAVGRIRMRVAGAHALTVNDGGALVARTGLGPVTFTAPVAYQERDGVRRPVTVAYHLLGREYGFRVGAYDPALALVIDPLLQSTYLGGSSGASIGAMAIHPTTGDVYVAGSAVSNFPGTTGGAQPSYAGGIVGYDGFVARLNSSLTTLIQATYLGGSFDDSASALAIHPMTGDVYVAGETNSSNFPGTTGGAQASNAGFSDAFVARLNSALTTLTRATYLGGSSFDIPHALAIHATTGDVYVAGQTGSHDFPGTTGSAQPSFAGGSSDAFVARLNSALTTLSRATYLGGSYGIFLNYDSADALAIHPTTGEVYVAGQTGSDNFPGTTGGAQPSLSGGFLQDGFVARLNGALTVLIQATYLGGVDRDLAYALAIHPTTGDVYVAGSASSKDFPGTTGGAQPSHGSADFNNAFIARFNRALTTLIQATYLGGCCGELAWALAIHPTTGDIYVAGETRSSNFPGTTGGAQPSYAGGQADGFVARLNSALTALTQVTYLGGSDTDGVRALAIHPTTGDIYVAGGTASSNFPGTTGGAQASLIGFSSPFVARLTAPLTAIDPAPDLTVAKTHNGSFTRGQVGATYKLTVSNVGMVATTGTVTVIDTLPSGLTATALGGPGWNCTLATLTCTRADAVAGGASYPHITLTVNVAVNASSSLINTVVVSGGGDSNPGNNTVNDPTSVTTFTDVAQNHPFIQWIDALFAAGITGGCATTPPQYCPDNAVTRGQMAVFLLRGIHGAGYNPPAATGTMFGDVPIAHPFAKWIEQLAREGITGGCSASPPLYCPDAGVTRGQMAVFLLRGKHGAGYDPPAATGTMFGDVPITHPFAKWIEQLAREGVTGGCSTSPPRYCPDGPVTRGQMAVFLVRAFNLPL